MFETALDIGFLSGFSDGDHFTDVFGLIVLSYHVDGKSRTSPFVSIGGGASSPDFGSNYSTARFDAGIGVRRKVAAEHGSFKFE